MFQSKERLCRSLRHQAECVFWIRSHQFALSILVYWWDPISAIVVYTSLVEFLHKANLSLRCSVAPIVDRKLMLLLLHHINDNHLFSIFVVSLRIQYFWLQYFWMHYLRQYRVPFCYALEFFWKSRTSFSFELEEMLLNITSLNRLTYE